MSNKKYKYIDDIKTSNPKKDFTIAKDGRVNLSSVYYMSIISEHILNYLKSLNELHFNRKAFFVNMDFITDCIKREMDQFNSLNFYKVPTVFKETEIGYIATDIYNKIECYRFNKTINAKAFRNCVNKNKTHLEWIRESSTRKTKN